MIREISLNECDVVYKFAEKDIARNYFILLALKSKIPVYEKIYGEYIEEKLKAVLFKRKSGTLQFYAPEKFDRSGFIELISTLEYKGLIGPRSYCDKLFDKSIFSTSTDGAYISKLGKEAEISALQTNYKTREISIEDLDDIVELYGQVFSSFAPKRIMKEKLLTKRGRGLCIEKKNKIISVAQSDFETKDAAIIVGIATKKEYRCKGLATQCLQELCKDLLSEGKDLYLQYDNLEAGRVYEKQGFEVLDQVVHLK